MSDPVVKPRRRWRRLFLLLLVLGVSISVFRSVRSSPTIHPGSVMLLRLHGSYPEAAPDQILDVFAREERLSLFDVVDLIRDARQDERIKGLVVQVGGLDLGWGKAQEIRDALLALRQSGKSVIAYVEQEFSSSTLEYYIASGAQKVYLPPASTAPVTGLLAQFTFFGGLWDKLDVEMEVHKIGAYKSAGDAIGGREMTPEHLEMTNWLLDSYFGQLVTGIATARDLDPIAVRAGIDRAPMTAKELSEVGFADGERTLGEIRRDLLGGSGTFLSTQDYRAAGGWVPAILNQRSVAVIYGSGMITGGESRGGAFTARSMGSDTMVEAFAEALKDDSVAAILFRVDSPGGSALASDLIWQETQRVKERKPIIVSMSDVAGSGGYYVAAGATKIFADPGTLTGSIGVVMSKPNISGLLTRVGVNTVTVKRGELALLGSTTDSLRPVERERIDAAMNHVYDVFVDRVAVGRRLTHDVVNSLGEGRVWTGEQALANGLVDELGGFFAALDAAKTAGGIPVSEGVALEFYPKPQPFLARVSEFMGTRMATEMPAWLAELHESVAAFDFPDGAILTLMPHRIEIR